MSNKEVWTESPITGKQQVLTELDEKGRVSKFDISSGYFTNEYPMNYKKNPDFDFNDMESQLPEIVKDLKFDDGESYWYPTTIQAENGMVFPVGTIDDWKWCYAPIEFLSEDEQKQYSQNGEEFNQKINMEAASYYDRYIDAIKNINGYSLGDIELDEQAD